MTRTLVRAMTIAAASWLLWPTTSFGGDSGSSPASIEHLAAVLGEFVDEGRVDYAALSRQRSSLDRFIADIAHATPDTFERSEAVAFWINSYNAVTLKLVLDSYPGLQSVMEVPGFFKEARTRVGGEFLTLDEIEQRALGLGDPRVHFAVVCASIGCPDLRAEPYRATVLDRQLHEQTRAYLADSKRGARFDAIEGVFWLSSIFKWYGGDFTGGSDLGAYVFRRRLLAWVEPHLPVEIAAAVADRSPDIRFLDYDWGLNESSPGGAGDDEP